MSTVLTPEEEAAMYKRLLREKKIYHTISTVSFAWIACTANVAVGSLDFWARVGLFFSVAGLWSDKMQAFVDQTAGKLVKGKPPIGDDTTHFEKPSAPPETK